MDPAEDKKCPHRWQYMASCCESWNHDSERFLVEPIVLRICLLCERIDAFGDDARGWYPWHP